MTINQCQSSYSPAHPKPITAHANFRHSSFTHCSRIFSDYVIANFPLNAPVK